MYEQTNFASIYLPVHFLSSMSTMSRITLELIAPSKLYIPTSIYYKPMNEWYSRAELLRKGGEY